MYSSIDWYPYYLVEVGVDTVEYELLLDTLDDVDIDDEVDKELDVEILKMKTIIPYTC